MPSILRHPRFADPVPELLAEAERLDYEEMVLGFDAHRQRRGPQLLQFLTALAVTGFVLAVAYLTGLGE